jgi:hypothetical protein
LLSETGTGQGQVISPLLANIYLHYVLDAWFETVVKPRLKGEVYEIRYADDFILCFQLQEDAERVLDALVKRFAKYGLKLHPEKTRLIEFGGKPWRNRKSRVDRSRLLSTFSDLRTSADEAGKGSSRFTFGQCGNASSAVSRACGLGANCIGTIR